jgi:hypothetical protein
VRGIERGEIEREKRQVGDKKKKKMRQIGKEKERERS